MSDYQVGDTLYFNFTTRSFSTGAPTTLAGTPVVSIYEDNSVTQITAGITLTVDLDGVTGLNNVAVVATGGNGFETGKFYSLVITTGTVGGVSVVGEVVANFSLEASAAALDLANGTDGLGALDAKLGTPAGASVSADIAQIEGQTDDIGVAGAGLTGIPWNSAWDSEVQSEVQDAIEVNKLDHLVAVAESDDPVDNSIMAKIAASDGDWSGFDPSTDAQEAIRDRGDANWVTGGGGAITQSLNLQAVIPTSIDVADTVSVRLGLILFNALDDLPSTAEITPGTISIDRKAIGGTAWVSVVSDQAMTEQAGMVYFDEVFDTTTGYAEGDSIRVTFKSVSITADANTFEICDANGIIFQTEIRQTMRGTNNAALASVITIAAINATVDTALTDYDGPTNAELVSEINDVQSDIAALNDVSVSDVNAQVDAALNTAIPVSPTAGSVNRLIKDWLDGERLDLLIDGITTIVTAIQTTTDNLPDSGALTTINTNIAAIKAKTDNLPGAVPKNVELANFTFLMVDETDFATPETGLTVTAQVSKDGGAFSNSTNSVVEISNGVYRITLTATEMDADVVTLRFTATNAAQRIISIITDA